MKFWHKLSTGSPNIQVRHHSCVSICKIPAVQAPLFPSPCVLYYSAEDVWLTNYTLKLTHVFPSLFLLLPHINMDVIVGCNSHLPVMRRTFPQMRDSIWTLSVLYIPISQFLIPWGKWAPYLRHCSVLNKCPPKDAFVLIPRTCDCDALRGKMGFCRCDLVQDLTTGAYSGLLRQAQYNLEGYFKWKGEAEERGS